MLFTIRQRLVSQRFKLNRFITSIKPSIISGVVATKAGSKYSINDWSPRMTFVMEYGPAIIVSSAIVCSQTPLGDILSYLGFFAFLGSFIVFVPFYHNMESIYTHLRDALIDKGEDVYYKLMHALKIPKTRAHDLEKPNDHLTVSAIKPEQRDAK